MIKNIEGTTIKIKFKDEILELPKDIKEKINNFWELHIIYMMKE